MPTPRDRGQAAVEFAIALPLVLVVVVGIVQVAAVVGDLLAIELAAREGARAAAVSSDPAAAAQAAAAAATGLGPLDVTTSVHGDAVTVRVRHRHQPVSVFAVLIDGIDLDAEVTMALDPP